MFRQRPHLDVVFNCARYVHAGTIPDGEVGSWKRSFALNVDSMIQLCKAPLPGMLPLGRGSVINMSSVVSAVNGATNRFAYGTTKAAVIGLTMSIAADYVSRGGRRNAIYPGAVNTPWLNSEVAAVGGDQSVNLQKFVDRQPLGRLGEPEEITALAA